MAIDHLKEAAPQVRKHELIVEDVDRFTGTFSADKSYCSALFKSTTVHEQA
jgi:hypothetical protein